MAKSKSKKRREHLIRNGKQLAQENLSKVDFSIHERKTPTLAERVRRSERKHAGRFSEYDLANWGEVVCYAMLIRHINKKEVG